MQLKNLETKGMVNTPLISARQLGKLLNEEIIIIDAGSGGDAHEDYLQKHIPGAFYLDLNGDLSEVPDDPQNGGRHPLPPAHKFGAALRRLGICSDSHIVVYDNKYGSNAAARLWWMLKSAGIKNVCVLDGGLQSAIAEGVRMDSGHARLSEPGNFQFTEWKLPTADIGLVEKKLRADGFLVVDVREKVRYDGRAEPIDPVAGHIPGALNVPFKDNLKADGTFKSAQELREIYSGIFKDIPAENIAFHCGSGVTACHSLLAVAIAGMQLPRLYVGSWSEWCRSGNEIETDCP